MYTIVTESLIEGGGKFVLQFSTPRLCDYKSLPSVSKENSNSCYEKGVRKTNSCETKTGFKMCL